MNESYSLIFSLKKNIPPAKSSSHICNKFTKLENNTNKTATLSAQKKNNSRDLFFFIYPS